MLNASTLRPFNIQISCEKLRRCRVCLKVTTDRNNDFVNIFDSCFENENDTSAGSYNDAANGIRNYLQLFNECTNLKIDESHLRDLQLWLDSEWSVCHFLCGTCKDDLISAYKFLMKAQWSNNIINEKINAVDLKTKAQLVTSTINLDDLIEMDDACGGNEMGCEANNTNAVISLLKSETLSCDNTVNEKSLLEQELDAIFEGKTSFNIGTNLESVKNETIATNVHVVNSDIIDIIQELSGSWNEGSEKGPLLNALSLDDSSNGSNATVTSQQNANNSDCISISNSNSNSSNFTETPQINGICLDSISNRSNLIAPSRIDENGEESIFTMNSRSDNASVSWPVETADSSKQDDFFIEFLEEPHTADDSSQHGSHIENNHTTFGIEPDFDSFPIRNVVDGPEIEILRDKRKEKNGARFKCNLCLLTFALESSLLKHCAEDHDEESEAYQFACVTCKKRFVNKHALRMHSRAVHENCEFLDCPQCGRMVLKNFYNIHLRRHANKTVASCDKCPSKFSTRYQLKQHIQIKHQSRPPGFHCDKCDSSFYVKHNLLKHQEIHRQPEERELYKCQICNKSFLIEGNLKYHMSIHRGESVKCLYCPKRFSRAKDLEVHESFHTKDFKYNCEICGRKFGILTHLKDHLKKHNNIQYQCKICRKKFRTMGTLRSHSFLHSEMPYFCNICNRGTSSKFKARRHLHNVHHNLLFQNVEYTDSLADQYITATETAPHPDFDEITENDDDEPQIETDFIEYDDSSEMMCGANDKEERPVIVQIEYIE